MSIVEIIKILKNEGQIRSHPTYFSYFCGAMKYLCTVFLTIFLVSCAQTDDEKAARLLDDISRLYESGQYRQTLDSIEALRERYPKAIASRRKALGIWQEASLRMAQADVAKTDSLLQATLMQIAQESDLGRANQLRVRRDSLDARYQAMCGVVRMIRARQKQN